MKENNHQKFPMRKISIQLSSPSKYKKSKIKDRNSVCYSANLKKRVLEINVQHQVFNQLVTDKCSKNVRNYTEQLQDCQTNQRSYTQNQKQQFHRSLLSFYPRNLQIQSKKNTHLQDDKIVAQHLTRGATHTHKKMGSTPQSKGLIIDSNNAISKLSRNSYHKKINQINEQGKQFQQYQDNKLNLYASNNSLGVQVANIQSVNTEELSTQNFFTNSSEITNNFSINENNYNPSVSEILLQSNQTKFRKIQHNKTSKQSKRQQYKMNMINLSKTIHNPQIQMKKCIFSTHDFYSNNKTNRKNPNKLFELCIKDNKSGKKYTRTEISNNSQKNHNKYELIRERRGSCKNYQENTKYENDCNFKESYQAIEHARKISTAHPIKQNIRRQAMNNTNKYLTKKKKQSAGIKGIKILPEEILQTNTCSVHLKSHKTPLHSKNLVKAQVNQKMKTHSLKNQNKDGNKGGRHAQEEEMKGWDTQYKQKQQDFLEYF